MPDDPQIESLKLPPHSLEAEQSILGALLLDDVLSEGKRPSSEPTIDALLYRTRQGLMNFLAPTRRESAAPAAAAAVEWEAAGASVVSAAAAALHAVDAAEVA